MNSLLQFLPALAVCFLVSYGVYDCFGQRMPKPGVSPLELKGRVLELNRAGDNATAIGFDAVIAFDLRNVGQKPLIIYNGGRSPWLGAVLLARTGEDSRLKKYLIKESVWPSLWGNESRLRIHNLLDQRVPPPEATTILKPGQIWSFEATARFDICKKTSAPDCDGTVIWDQIKNSTLFLEAVFEMWPVNVEPKSDPDNPEFGLVLRKRWRHFGELWLDYLASQPLELNLSS